MKVSLKQLETVLYKLKATMLGYNDDKDMEVEISLTQEDPGNGILTDCLTVKGSKQGTEEEKLETIMSIEVYPYADKVDPIATKTESFKVTKKY